MIGRIIITVWVIGFLMVILDYLYQILKDIIKDSSLCTLLCPSFILRMYIKISNYIEDKKENKILYNLKILNDYKNMSICKIYTDDIDNLIDTNKYKIIDKKNGYYIIYKKQD